MSDGAVAAATPGLRVLLFSLEFLSPFSGNGQYSRCIVRGLKRAGATVLVVSGRPVDAPLEAQDAEARAHCAAPHGVVDIALPVWGRLDRACAWEAFREGCCAPACVARAAAFAPSVVVCVDYHTGLAWPAVRALLAPALAPAPPPPMVYLNFRLFCTSTALHAPPSAQDAGGVSDAQFYRAAERASMAAAVRSVALCRQDALQLLALAAGVDPVSGAAEAAAGAAGGAAAPRALPALATLLPPLRSDVCALVGAAAGTQAHCAAGGGGGALPPALLPSPGHALITSLVRLSPEKNALAVPQLLLAAEAAHPGLLTRSHLQPFFTGCGEATAYARQVKDAAAALPPAPAPPLLCTTFLGPLALGQALQASALNLHPCLADAYGMTIVEAAAWGVPSLVNVPGALGGAGEERVGAGSGDAVSPGALFVPQGCLGCCCTEVTLEALQGSAARAYTEADLSSLGMRLFQLSRALPPVGACDLLAPHPASGSAAEQGIVCFDFAAPVEAQVERLVLLLAQASARARGEAGGLLDSVAAVARKRALAWTEESHGIALLQLLTRAAAGH